ncbi:translation elongation factor Ts [Anopheles sinensis]|uniref:Translation elongation factor Ts n=1 Tax=Anopheles sinensis TaxID=74873 RepID=A0A084VMM5_ANOSI|nr:translation elongation factor Ts [Anopheles sinensis]
MSPLRKPTETTMPNKIAKTRDFDCGHASALISPTDFVAEECVYPRKGQTDIGSVGMAPGKASESNAVGCTPNRSQSVEFIVIA